MSSSLTLPKQLPVMPLPGAVLFPHALLPLYIFEPRYRQMLADALHSNRMFSVAMQKPGSTRDMRANAIDMLTIGQYLQPTAGHLPVLRYVHPDTFAMFEREALAMGFRHAAVGPLIRSSYHADRQAHGVVAGLP